MRLAHIALLSLPWPFAAAIGCNGIFGIKDGQNASGGGATTGATTTTSATTSTSATTTTSTTTTGTGDGGACQPDRSPPCNADGGVCTPQVLDDTQDDAVTLLVTGDYLVYSSGNGGTVQRLRYDGTGYESYTSPTDAFHIASDGVGLYWTDYYCCPDYVQQMPLSGGTIIPLADLPQQQIGSGGIAAYGGTVYWSMYSPAGVMSISAASTSQAATYIAGSGTSANAPSPGPIAINDADHVYWGDAAGLLRLSLAAIGSTGAQSEVFGAGASPEDIALDADTVYWVTNTGEVRSKPKAAPTAQVAHVYFQSTGSDAPVAVASDGAHVFWLAQNGVVNKVAKAGGQVVQVSASPAGMGSPSDIAVDCGAVYWTVDSSANQSKAILYRAAKGP